MRTPLILRSWAVAMLLVAAVGTIALVTCARTDSARESAPDVSVLDSVVFPRDTAHVTVSGPTVIAYFIVPPGAVDTMPNLAVEADDWNYAMAMLRDSLEAGGVALALAVDGVVRIDSAESRDVVLALGPALTAGYIFVRPGEPPCLRRGGLDQPDLLVLARRFFARPRSLDVSPTRCSSPGSRGDSAR